MIKYSFKQSFDKSLKKLPKKQKEKIKRSCIELIEVLEKNQDLKKGLRLKQLTGNIYEISRGMKTRIIFSWQNNRLTFILAGNHDQIKTFLKENT